MTTKEQWHELDQRMGHTTIEGAISISDYKDWIQRMNNKHGPPKWFYECNCGHPAGYRSPPYCPDCGMKLVYGYKEDEKI